MKAVAGDRGSLHPPPGRESSASWRASAESARSNSNSISGHPGGTAVDSLDGQKGAIGNE
jgi:hypothetical protein